MSAYSIKNQEKVLKKLIQLRNDSDTPWIYRPKNFEDNFPFIEPQFLIDILAMLQANEYVNVVYADLPESFNIETISGLIIKTVFPSIVLSYLGKIPIVFFIISPINNIGIN